MNILKKLFVVVAAMAVLGMGPALAADKGTKPEAVAMVKKAAEFIKGHGKDAAFVEFSNKGGAFRDRDLYVLVYDLNGNCLAHGINPKLVGKNNLEAQDADGFYYVKNRLELAKKSSAFWQDYKFVNPVTKMIEPKSTYCEVHDQMLVCVGIYK